MDRGAIRISTRENIKNLIKAFPPELQREVEDFVRFLLEKIVKKRGKILRQDWAGAFRDFREQYLL